MLEVAKNILASKLPFARYPDFAVSLLVNFRKAADSVPIEFRNDFLEAIGEFRSTVSAVEGSVINLRHLLSL